MKLVTAALVLWSSTAFARPAPDEPDPPAASDAAPVIKPLPITTISTMPVSTTIPGTWDDRSRSGAWIVTGIAGATAVAAVSWHFLYDRFTHIDKPPPFGIPCQPDYTGGIGDKHNCAAPNVPLTSEQQRKQRIFEAADIGLAIGSGAMLLISAYMWSRHYTPSKTILVSPTANGGAVSYSGTFR